MATLTKCRDHSCCLVAQSARLLSAFPIPMRLDSGSGARPDASAASGARPDPSLASDRGRSLEASPGARDSLHRGKKNMGEEFFAGRSMKSRDHYAGEGGEKKSVSSSFIKPLEQIQTRREETPLWHAEAKVRRSSEVGEMIFSFKAKSCTAQPGRSCLWAISANDSIGPLRPWPRPEPREASGQDGRPAPEKSV